MEFKDYINAAIKKTDNSQRELAKKINVLEQNLTHAKNNRRGLPEEAIWRMAELIGVDPARIVEAQQYALAKTEEKREFWKRYIDGKNVAGIALLLAICAAPYPTKAEDSSTYKTKQSVDLYYVKL